MASYKISQLPATSGVTSGTLFEISKAGVSEQATLTQVTALVTTAYIAADAVVAASVTAEATTRANADTTLTTDVNTRVKKDGSTPLTANWATGGFKLTGLAAGTTAGDSVRYEQVLLLAGGTMSGAIAMGTNKITGLGNPTAAQDAVTLAYLNSARLVFVDASYGNDGTGAKYSSFKPYATITAAQTAAVSGDTIVIYPGTYSESGLGKNGVNYHFINGAILAATTSIGFINTGALSYTISGDGELTSTTAAVIDFEAAGTISVSAKKISSTSGFAITARSTSVMYIDVKESITATSGRCFQLYDTAAVYVKVPIISITSGYAVASSSYNGTILNINAQKISSAGTTLFDIIGNAKIYGDLVYTGVASGITSTSGGTCSIEYFGNITTSSAALIIEYTNSNSGTIDFYGKITSTGNISIAGTTATISFYNEIAINKSTVPAISMTSGTVKILNTRLTNLDANAASYGITKTTGTLILQNAVIKTGAGGASSVYSATAQDIKILGTLSANVALGANITDICSGIQQIDSNVE